MKDLYGKTHVKYGLPGFAAYAVNRLGALDSDVRNLKAAFVKRPLLIPAFLMLLCSLSCYYLSSFLPSVIIGICVTVTAFCHVRSSGGRWKDMIPVIAIALMLSLLLVCNGLIIGSRLNASVRSERLECVVTEASQDLSGSLDMTVRLNDGPLAKVRFSCDHGDFVPGETLILYGRITEPDRAGNPGEFDYREYLRKKGILYTVKCESYTVVEDAHFPVSLAGWLQGMFFRFRKDVFETVTGSYDASDRALAAAVCLGDRSLISDSVERDFSMSCCSHLLAVSGTHFSGFLMCIPPVLNAFKVKRKAALAVHVFFCIIIGCLTGWSDSVTRAAVMSVCVFADRDWLSALSLASLVMITADPFCALSSGFQMSFCAVLSIKICSGKITEILMRICPAEYAAKIISPAIAAGIGLIPFWSDISMRPDPEHLAIQTAGSFVAGAACAFFVPCVLLCYLLPFWNLYLSAPLLVCLKVLSRLVSAGCRLSEQSGMPVHLGKVFLCLLGLAVFLYMIPACMLRRMFLKPVAVLLAVTAGFEAVTYVKRPDCRVIFADVGQGDCCLVMTPDTICLIDGGTYKEGSTTVCDLLDYYGISSVDVCIMSHWDADHAGGIAALCEMGRTERICTSYLPAPGDTDKDVRDFFESVDPGNEYGDLFLSELERVPAGSRIELSDNVYIEVLYPSSCSGGGNEMSLVMMLHIVEENDVSILFTGDIGTKTEAVLTEDGTALDCDILKVAHHGSKYSTSDEFLSACSPDIAVISVGARNLYGHPAPATVERLEAHGCEVFRTDTEGAVVLEF